MTQGRSWPSGSEIKVFWGAFFSKKVRPCPCPYRRAAQKRKLGKQRSAFPERRSASAVNSRPWQLASLVLIERIAHVRAGGRLPSPPPFGGHSRLPARSSAERCPLGTSAPLWGALSPAGSPQRGRRDEALRKLWAAHILSSPFGGRWHPYRLFLPAAGRVGLQAPLLQLGLVRLLGDGPAVQVGLQVRHSLLRVVVHVGGVLLVDALQALAQRS